MIGSNILSHSSRELAGEPPIYDRSFRWTDEIAEVPADRPRRLKYAFVITIHHAILHPGGPWRVFIQVADRALVSKRQGGRGSQALILPSGACFHSASISQFASCWNRRPSLSGGRV
jgi:hypothetical protein